MRFPLAWLCLLIALAGPLMDLSRRAYGFGLSLEEMGQTLYESADEEADEAADRDTLSSLAIATANGAHAFDPLGSSDFIYWDAVPLGEQVHVFEVARYRLAPGPRPPTSPQRRASLQIFLF